MNALNFADSPDTMNTPPLCDDITSVDSIIARVLDIDIDQVRDELSYQSISQWDSLRHVTLMLALEEAFGVDISADLMLHLSELQTRRAPCTVH